MASFHIHPELYKFLEGTRFNIVSQVLIHQGNYTTDEGDWVRKEPGIDVVSYIPRSKIKYLDPNIDPFNDEKLRVRLRVGKFASKFLFGPVCREVGVKDKSIEDFVNLYKSYFNCDFSKLKVIEGEEILKYYDMNYYARVNGSATGTLWASCMRYPEKNKFMEIYTKNANCKMLVYLEDDGRLRSRALLWEDAKDKYGNVYKVMDRIYSLYDHDVSFFKEWASKNGYISKSEQSSKSEQFFSRDGKNIRLHLSVKLENHKFKLYPYFDTFKFYDPETGNFGNSESFKYQHYLVQNWGGLEPEQRESVPDFGQESIQSTGRLYGQTNYASFLSRIVGVPTSASPQEQNGQSDEPVHAHPVVQQPTQVTNPVEVVNDVYNPTNDPSNPYWVPSDIGRTVRMPSELKQKKKRISEEKRLFSKYISNSTMKKKELSEEMVDIYDQLFSKPVDSPKEDSEEKENSKDLSSSRKDAGKSSKMPPRYDGFADYFDDYMEDGDFRV